MSYKNFLRQVNIAKSESDTTSTVASSKTIFVKGHVASKEEIERNRRSKYEYIF